MTEAPDRRRAARLGIPQHLIGSDTEFRPVQLLDLSAEGARIEHALPLPHGLVCYIELPPAIGHLRLTCVVVWSRLCKGEQTAEAARHVYYQSGLTFVGMIDEQKTALAAALEFIRAETSRTGGDTAEPTVGL